MLKICFFSCCTVLLLVMIIIACLLSELISFKTILVAFFIITSILGALMNEIRKIIRKNIFVFSAAFFFSLTIPLSESIAYEIQFIFIIAFAYAINICLGTRYTQLITAADLGFLTGISLSLYFSIDEFNPIIPKATYYFIGMIIALAIQPIISSLACIPSYINNPEKKKKQNNINRLFPERCDILKSCVDYIGDNSILGISSPYGNGKSFIINLLKKEYEEWTFIDIGVLSTTTENIETIILKEIGDFLEKKGIGSSSVDKIKSFLSQDVFYHIGEFIFGNESYVQQFSKVVEDLQSSNETIVLNFEDLDRINSAEHLNKLFAICDTLVKIDREYARQSLKIIYQYNSELLDNSLNELCSECDKGRYKERFIPFSIHIPVIEPAKMFEKVRDENPEKYPNLKDISFAFIKNRLTGSTYGLQRGVSFTNYRVRGIEHILNRANFSLKYLSEQDANYRIIMETVVIYHIAEYFMKDVIDVLETANSLESLKLFDDGIQLRDFNYIDRVYTNAVRNPNIPQPDFFTDNKRSTQNRYALYFLNMLNCDSNYLTQKKTRPFGQKNIPPYYDEIAIKVLNRMVKSRQIDGSVVND